MNNLDWELIKAFLSVAELGSLSAAARHLGVSQPTLSRQIQALETTTELSLFKRTTQGLLLSAEGKTLIEAAQQMQAAAAHFSRQVSGLSLELEGDVRISANEIIGNYLLPPALAALRKEHPGVQLEIVISNQASSLSKREADIALRMFRPEQPDLVARRLPDISLGFYAHRDLLAEKGVPQAFQQLSEYCFIGYDSDRSIIEGAAIMGITLNPQDFALRTDYLMTQFALLRSAAGVGIAHVGLAAQYPELVPVLTDTPIPPLEFWCVCHSDVQFNSRIRVVMNFLSEWLAIDPYAKTLV